jgi:DNA-binding NarL/FixJ family response regulator
VLRLTADHLSCKEIAERLFLSPRTVQTHRANATQKLRLPMVCTTAWVRTSSSSETNAFLP